MRNIYSLLLVFVVAAAFVCHCIFSGVSSPPRLSGTMWSMTYPVHVRLSLSLWGRAAPFGMIAALWCFAECGHSCRARNYRGTSGSGACALRWNGVAVSRSEKIPVTVGIAPCALGVCPSGA
jgi:hypothetical protein